MATFSVRFLGCKVSHTDAHAVREALVAGGRDNITVIVVDATGLTEALESTAPRDGRAGHDDDEDTVPRRSPWKGAMT